LEISKKSLTKPAQAAILCGGLGTRLRPYTDSMPKPMIDCGGKPFLWHIMQQLSAQGVNRFILLTGYLSEQIEEYFGDGSQWDWDICYSIGPIEWDTGTRIWEARNQLDDIFLLLYSDNFAQFSLDKIFSLHRKNKTSLTLIVAPKKSGNISLGKDSLVRIYDNKRSDLGLDYVEIGYMIIEKDKVLSFYENPDCSLSLILQRMASKDQISAWVQHGSYHSISDPERWKRTAEYLSFKKIILIDRDGVINKKAPQGQYVSKWEDFEWIKETRVAMRALAKNGFKFIVITNQAGISRGLIDPEKLKVIHNNMKDELSDEGIEILDIYVCPHHWDDKCSCRKPNPGMFFQASQDYLFRLEKVLYIGDDSRDCQAASNAGSFSIFIGERSTLSKLDIEELPLLSVTSIKESIKTINCFYDI
jgi:histidinol-phosphate phosphatase family protein